MSKFVKKFTMEYSFEKLVVYQTARKLVKEVYILISRFPREEKFGLADQLRRSIVSVPSNIAEQSGRTSIKEKVHFLEIAYGSLMEAYCQLDIAVDLEYISKEELAPVKNIFFDTSRLIFGLKKRLADQTSNP